MVPYDIAWVGYSPGPERAASAADGGEVHELDPGIVIPDLIFGVVALLGGVIVIIFRKRLTDWVISSEKNALGEERGNRLGMLQTPFWSGVTGIGISSVGLIMIGFGVVALTQHLGSN